MKGSRKRTNPFHYDPHVSHRQNCLNSYYQQCQTNNLSGIVLLPSRSLQAFKTQQVPKKKLPKSILPITYSLGL